MHLGRIRLSFVIGLVCVLVTAVVLLHFAEPLWLLGNNYYWHWKHHDRVTMGGYDVPVPRMWMVQSLNDSSLLLADIGPDRKGIGTVDIFAHYQPPENLERLDRMHRNVTVAGMMYRGETKVPIGDEVLLCSDSDLTISQGLTITSVECHTPNISIRFGGSRAEVPRFYGWVRGVRPAATR